MSSSRREPSSPTASIHFSSAGQAWRSVATDAGADAVEIEVVCSDVAERRLRVESRQSDMCLPLPTGQEVITRDHEAWNLAHVTVDTATQSVEQGLQQIMSILASLRSLKPATARRTTTSLQESAWLQRLGPHAAGARGLERPAGAVHLGEGERDSLCRSLTGPGIRRNEVARGHHDSGEYGEQVDRTLAFARTPPPHRRRGSHRPEGPVEAA